MSGRTGQGAQRYRFQNEGCFLPRHSFLTIAIWAGIHSEKTELARPWVGGRAERLPLIPRRFEAFLSDREQSLFDLHWKGRKKSNICLRDLFGLLTTAG